MSIDFCFCSLKDNLIQKVFSEQTLENTAFIFPTERSKRYAIREFQEKWQFSDTVILTMEELKERLFFSDRPLLREEKRTLSFFNSLETEDVKKFKINNYFQSIELANNFFDLFQEFNEELFGRELTRDFFSSFEAEFYDWQFETYQYLLKIKGQYRQFCHSRGFDDVIFTYKPENLNMDSLVDFDRIIFVNQFYYTNLEKKIIERLSDSWKAISVYFQVPEELVKTEDLTVRDFSLQDFREYRTEKVHIATCKNDFSMMIHLCEKMEHKPMQTVVDAAPSQQAILRLFDAGKFRLSGAKDFTHTSIYSFFSILLEFLDNMIWDSDRKQYLFPLQNILNAVLSNSFWRYFSRDKNRQTFEKEREILLTQLYKLVEKDYKYLDLDGKFLQLFPKNRLKFYLQDLLKLLKSLQKISSLQKLIDLIDSPEGIRIKEIISGQERDFSDILDVFYRMLADFLSSEELGLIESWDKLFDQQDSRSNLQTSRGILRLFLEYMKSKNIHYFFLYNNETPRTEILTLLNTRDIQLDSVAIINLIEGFLPHARKTPFLFTERQRKILGMKTFDEIKMREKYYFYRLVLNAREVFLFSQNDMEQNIQTSSFVEELKLCLPGEIIRNINLSEENYGEIYDHFFASNKEYATDRNVVKNPAFFTLPANIDQDFPENSLRLNFYQSSDLLENPFVYFIRHLVNVQERSEDVETDFSPKLIGNIVHDIMSVCWSLFEQNFAPPLFAYDFAFFNENIFRQAVQKVLRERDDYSYRLPHDFSYAYFEMIILPAIFEGVKGFFDFLESLRLDTKEMRVFPEKEYARTEEKIWKKLISAGENDLSLDVYIRGRADLRLEMLKEKKYYIFDYKTGKSEKEQLLFYELFYYILEQPELAERIVSYFYHVLEKRPKKFSDLYRNQKETKFDAIEEFKRRLQKVISQVIQCGYFLPKKKTDLVQLSDITRSDLFLMQKNIANQIY